MTQENKLHLPYVLYGISTRLHALFLQKLVLYDSQILQAKHLRHYDHQCQGLISLVNFLQRRINKNQIIAFQMMKNPQQDVSEDDQFIKQYELKQQPKKATLKTLEGNITPRTKFFTRANTSIQESDNSYIFSPTIKKNMKTGCKTQYFGSSSNVGDQRNDILQKLLNRVKKVNTEAYQQSLQPAKSSYFNLTLGKQSLQTFQNNCNNYECPHVSSSYKKQSKNMKRKKILQKFQKIQRKIYQEPPIYTSSYMTPRPRNHVQKYRSNNTAYSVYEPLTFHQAPREVVYVPINKKQQFNDYNSGLSSSKSVTHINYARQVYI